MKITLAVIVAIMLSVLAFWLSVTWSYPMSESCAVLKDMASRQGAFPEEASVTNVIPEVRLLSVLKYRRTATGFSLHFCPTRLGPCEVCTESLDPHFEEI